MIKACQCFRCAPGSNKPNYYSFTIFSHSTLDIRFWKYGPPLFSTQYLMFSFEILPIFLKAVTFQKRMHPWKSKMSSFGSEICHLKVRGWDPTLKINFFQTTWQCIMNMCMNRLVDEGLLHAHYCNRLNFSVMSVFKLFKIVHNYMPVEGLSPTLDKYWITSHAFKDWLWFENIKLKLFKYKFRFRHYKWNRLGINKDQVIIYCSLNSITTQFTIALKNSEFSSFRKHWITIR